MAHAIHINFGKHDRYGRPAHQHNGWWKFGAFAVTATAVGVFAVHTIWNTGPAPLPQQAPGIRIEVAPVASLATQPGLAPQTIPVSPSTSGNTAPVITAPAVSNAPAVPAPSTSAELDTPASAESVQKSVQNSGTSTQSNAAIVPPPVVSSSSANAAPNTAPAASGAPVAAASIRNLDMTAIPSLQGLATQLHGRIDVADTKYADLTGNGADEAIVPITSDGTQGNLGFAVVTQTGSGPKTILTAVGDPSHQGLVIGIDNGQLTETSAAYGPTDANCCPSQITRTYYRWNGSNLVVDHADTINVPQGKTAD